MLQIAICNHLPAQLAKINFAVEQYFKMYPNESIKIFTYTNPLVFLESLDKIGGFDVLLLDACMPGIDGIQVATEIRRRKDKSEIIFLANSGKFAVDAFALKAAHYLITPFTQLQFREAMDRAIAHFAEERVPKVALKLTGGGTRALDLNEILWIECNGHIKTVFLKDGGSEEARESLSLLFSVLEELSPGQFVSPRKGYLVNQNAILAVKPKSLMMRSGQMIPLARSTFRTFYNRYSTYMFPNGNRT